MLYIIIADDESFIRQSAIRVLEKLAKDFKIKINIIEAEDGFESLYIVYQAFTKGIKIDLILSDENMLYMTGRELPKTLI
jgi:CheY-like chemotaxis protein